MPSFSSSLATLTILPSDSASDQPRRERLIDRAILLDVAPDRETLIVSNKNIEELRHLLKIRIATISTG
jgi:hypothetical protein